MEINLIDYGSEISQEYKEVILKLIQFCNQSYPIKKNISVVLLNSQSESEMESNNEKLYILTKDKSLFDIIIAISDKWINLFITNKKVKLIGTEIEILLTKFLENNEQYRGLF